MHVTLGFACMPLLGFACMSFLGFACMSLLGTFQRYWQDEYKKTLLKNQIENSNLGCKPQWKDGYE